MIFSRYYGAFPHHDQRYSTAETNDITKYIYEKKIQENLLVPKSFHKQVWQKQMATLRETNSDMKTLISDQLVSARKM